MADLEWLGEPDRPTLRRAVRHRLRHMDPALRVVAEGFLAEQSEIDLLAVGNEGDLISVRIGHAGDDAVLLTQALSDLTWLRSRREHLLKLSPGLGLEPSAEPRALLICPAFSPETCSAAENLPARTIQRLSYRCLRLQGQLSILLTNEARLGSARHSDSRFAASESEATPSESLAAAPLGSAREPARPARLTDPPSPSSFRTGLSDADLGRPSHRAQSIVEAPTAPTPTDSTPTPTRTGQNDLEQQLA